MKYPDAAAKTLEFLSDPGWLDFCDTSRHAKRIPSGTTFLSQLLAHDMFMTEPRQNVCAWKHEKAGISSTVNLIDAPLMLSTIYGRTGVADQSLYQEDSPNRFDMLSFTHNQMAVRAPKFLRDPRQEWSYPALADARNYSTRILAQMAYAFMAFHNGLVGAFERKKVDPENIFALARATVLRAWFNIIKNDIIEKTCRANTNDGVRLGLKRGGLLR